MEMVRTTEPPSDAPSLPEPEVSACKSEYSEDSESMDEQSGLLSFSQNLTTAMLSILSLTDELLNVISNDSK